MDPQNGKLNQRSASNVRTFISDIYKYVFEDQTEEASSRPLTEAEPRNSSDVRFSIGSPVRTQQYSSQFHSNNTNSHSSNPVPMVHQSLQPQHLNGYTQKVQYPAQVQQHKRDISQPQRMSVRFGDNEIEQLNQLSPAHLQLSPRSRNQLSPRSRNQMSPQHSKVGSLTAAEQQLSPRGQRISGQFSPARGVLSPKRKIFESSDEQENKPLTVEKNVQAKSNIFTSEPPITNIKPPVNEAQPKAAEGKAVVAPKDQEQTPIKYNIFAMKQTEETPMNAFNSGTKMLSPNADNSIGDLKKTAEYNLNKKEGATVVSNVGVSKNLQKQQQETSKSQTIFGDRIVKQESVRVKPVDMSAIDNPLNESEMERPTHTLNQHTQEKVEPEDVQVHIPEEKHPEAPKSQNNYGNQFERSSTSSSNKSQKTKTPLSKRKKLVLSIPSIIAFGLISLTIAALAFLEMGNYGGSTMAAMQYLQMNLGRNSYYQSIYTIKANGSCKANENLINLGQFFGTTKGFMCDGVLYDKAPIAASNCQTVEGAPWKNLFVWEGISLCGKANTDAYLTNPGGTCDSGYRLCHKVQCVKSAEACPVNKISFTKNSNGTLIEASYQESLDRPPVIGFRVEVDSPCHDNFLLPRRAVTYSVDAKQGLYGCGEYGNDQSNFFSLDSASEKSIYNQNNLESDLSRLPKIDDALKSLNLYVEYRARLNLQADNLCFQKFPSKVFLEIETTIDSIRMHLYGLACLSILGFSASVMLSYLKRTSLSKKVLVIISLVSAYGLWIMVYYIWFQENELYAKANSYSSVDLGSCFADAQAKKIASDFRRSFPANLWWAVLLIYALACLGALTILVSLSLIALHFVIKRKAKKQAAAAKK